MKGAHRDGITESEREELPQIGLALVVVGLVGDDERLMTAAPQPVGDGLVVLATADRGVDHEQHEVGLVDGGLDLLADLRLEIVAARHPAAGVDHTERHTEPLGFELLAVARDTGPVLDDRRLLADDAIEQRALADVRPPDDHHRRQLELAHAVADPR